MPLSDEEQTLVVDARRVVRRLRCVTGSAECAMDYVPRDDFSAIAMAMGRNADADFA